MFITKSVSVLSVFLYLLVSSFAHAENHTIDIFCEDKKIYKDVCNKLKNSKISSLLMISEQDLKRFEIDNLNVIKFSFPRKIIQGDIFDRDMHGAQLAVLLSEMKF